MLGVALRWRLFTGSPGPSHKSIQMRLRSCCSSSSSKMHPEVCDACECMSATLYACVCVPGVCVCACVEQQKLQQQHCQPSHIEMKSFWPIKRQLRPTWSTRDPKPEPEPEPKPKPKPQTHFRFVPFAVYSAVHIVVAAAVNVAAAAAVIFLSVGHFASPKKSTVGQDSREGQAAVGRGHRHFN